MAMSHVPAHIRQAHGGHPTRGRGSSRAGKKAQVSGTRQNCIDKHGKRGATRKPAFEPAPAVVSPSPQGSYCLAERAATALTRLPVIAEIPTNRLGDNGVEEEKSCSPPSASPLADLVDSEAGITAPAANPGSAEPHCSAFDWVIGSSTEPEDQVSHWIDQVSQCCRSRLVPVDHSGVTSSGMHGRAIAKKNGKGQWICSCGKPNPVGGDPGRSPAQYALGLFSCTKAPSEEQAQDGAVVKGRLMKLQWSSVAPAIAADRLEEGDGTPSSDIGEDGTPATGSWQHWGELGLHKGELSCKCRLVLPLDPDVVVTPVVVKETVTRTVLREGPMVQEQVEIEKSVDRTSFRFELADLTAVKDILVDEVDALSAWRHLPAQKTSGVDANPLPLHEDLFHVQAGALGVTPSGGLGSEKICCKLCTREVQ
ncbi:unnamed protein product [Ectocarpus sp. 6 AP-2014]